MLKKTISDKCLIACCCCIADKAKIALELFLPEAPGKYPEKLSIAFVRSVFFEKLKTDFAINC